MGSFCREFVPVQMKELDLDRDKLPTERAHPAFPPGLFQKSDTYIRWRWKQVQFLADLFWKRWTKEYLPLLQERQKWTTVRKGYQVDDIVMVVDSSAPRGSWNLGRIIEVKPDSRGLMRTVKIITKTGVFENNQVLSASGRSRKDDHKVIGQR